MYKTEQENFWAGDFGNNYIKRNNDASIMAGKLRLFSDIFKCCNRVKSVIEFGSNIGLNIHAIKLLMPHVELNAIEINKKACEELSKINGLTIFNDSIISIDLKQKFDFVFTSGVLIHINPEELHNVYKRMYECTNDNGYIMVAEYYNPTPVSIDYRGEKDKLFKRDFAGELMDMYPNLELIDYGFTYHRAETGAEFDDTNWFLMRKKAKSNV